MTVTSFTVYMLITLEKSQWRPKRYDNNNNNYYYFFTFRSCSLFFFCFLFFFLVFFFVVVVVVFFCKILHCKTKFLYSLTVDVPIFTIFTTEINFINKKFLELSKVIKMSLDFANRDKT